MRRGTAAAAAAYVLWGVFPVYWKALDDVPALEILGHRIVWSLAVTGLLLVATHRLRPVAAMATAPGGSRVFVVTALLIGVNWLVYVWANNNGHMVEASLGYYITPLVSVVLGLAFLRERLRPAQWLAVIVAGAGVAHMVASSGGLLWVSLVLALSFGTYGLLRKTAPYGSLDGLTLELAVLLPLAALYLTWLAVDGSATLGAGQPVASALLLGAGAVTAAPLLLFAYGARRVTLVSLGLLQFIAPTLQLVIGVRMYGEPFERVRALGFGLVWAALVIYTLEGVVRRRSARASRVPARRSQRS